MLMPIMVFMIAVMRVLDQTGVLRRCAIVAVPVSTFRIMDQDFAISDRKIASAFGLNLPVIMATSALAILVSSGKRFAAFALPAIYGALVGIALRGVMHLVIF